MTQKTGALIFDETADRYDINGLISIAEWQERQRQAAIQQFVKRCEALYEQQRKEELTQ